MAHFLFKTEPDEYSFDDLARERGTIWDGITNALALKHLRGAARGDEVVVYHTGTERAAVGLATVASDPYPDPAFGDPRLVVVKLRADRRLARPVPLAAFRADRVLAGSDLVRNSRLGVVPLTAAQYARVLALGGA